MREFYVYILQCSDDSYYIGVTHDYERRVAMHKAGSDLRCYTYKRRPLSLVRLEILPTIIDAIAREKQLKGWSRRKKRALIAGDFDRLMRFAKRGLGTSFEAPLRRGASG